MVLKFSFILVLLYGCDMIPKKDNQKIIEERNDILESGKSNFMKCLKSDSLNASVLFHFKLFRTGTSLFGRPKALAFDPKTKKDEILINILPQGVGKQAEVSCIKDVLKKLEFQAVYPSVEYMETHEYLMKF